MKRTNRVVPPTPPFRMTRGAKTATLDSMRPAVLSLLAGAALAAPPKAPECVRNAEEAHEIARTRGKLIFLTVIVDHDAENRAVIDNVFRDREFLKIAPEFVIVYANNEDDHGKVTVKGPDGKPQVRCADCPNIECTDHMILAMNYARAFFPDSNARTPIHFVLNDKDEKIDTIMNGSFEQGFNHVPAKTVVARLKDLLKKHGRGLTEEEYARMEQDWVDAKAARARGNVTLELEKLNDVLTMPKEVEGVRLAKERVKEIDTAAAKDLEALDALVDGGKWEAALELVEKVQATYPGTLTAAAAKEKERELERRKEVKNVLKARTLYESAMKFKEKGKPDLAGKKLEEILRRDPDTRYAERAKTGLAALAEGG